jgi:hypothetical protein
MGCVSWNDYVIDVHSKVGEPESSRSRWENAQTTTYALSICLPVEMPPSAPHLPHQPHQFCALWEIKIFENPTKESRLEGLERRVVL